MRQTHYMKLGLAAVVTSLVLLMGVGNAMADHFHGHWGGGHSYYYGHRDYWPQWSFYLGTPDYYYPPPAYYYTYPQYPYVQPNGGYYVHPYAR